MKRILLIATGGTIASKHTAKGLTPLISSEELLSYVPQANDFCQTTAIQILNLDSTNVQPKHWLIMAKTIEDNYPDYDGFVICHGTDTMAYTASALSYLIQNSCKPIIITGAQKPIDLEVTDAKTNLLDSLRFASSEKAHDVLMVFDGKAIAGTRAKKERSKSYNAFSSINYPYKAVIQGNNVIFYIDDKPATPSKVTFYHTLNPNIFLLKLIPSLDPALLDDLIKHYDGIIIEAFGVGGLPSYHNDDYYKSIEKWVQSNKIVVMTTQVTREGSDMTIYQVGHSLKKQLDLIEAYDMTLESTVTKLMWILGQTTLPEEVKKLFNQTINHDILFLNS